MIDRYIYGSSSRLSPEAPVPVLNSIKEQNRLGGAANVARNLRHLGGMCTLFTLVGDDDDSKLIAEMLDEKGIDYEFSIDKSRQTTVKSRIISNGQQLVRVDYETKKPFLHKAVWYEKLEKKLKTAEIVIISDYAKGCISECQRIIDLCLKQNVPIIVDPKGASFNKYSHATLLTQNEAEIAEVIGHTSSEEDLRVKVFQLILELGLGALLLTRSEKGMTLFHSNEVINFKARTREVIDVTGAGDTVIAALATFMANGSSLEDATYRANVAAGIVVGKHGTSAVTLDEINLEIDGNVRSKVMDQDALERVIATWKENGETVVFTNGCFDILHVGHADYLSKAKSLGSKLIVFVNSDHSVKRLKGHERPINNEEQRMKLLASLHCVDAVCVFTEDTPEKIYNRLIPDILVKGGDYETSEIVGASVTTQNGGKVVTIPIEYQTSTSALITRLNSIG